MTTTTPTGLKIQFANLNPLNQTVYLSMYGDNQQGGPTCSFTLNSTTGEVTLTPLTSSSTVPEIKFSEIPLIDNVPTINLGTQWIDSARIYFSVGAKLSIPVSASGAVTNPGPLVAGYEDANYDWIEFTLNDSAVIYINTTQVDMFGLPIQLSIDPVDGSGSTRVGILQSRDSILADFQTFMSAQSQSAQDTFSSLLQNDKHGNPQRILNPTDAITLGVASTALNSYFDSYVTEFFNKYDSSKHSGVQLNLTANGVAGSGANGSGLHTLEGEVTTISGTDVLGQTATYQVLELTDKTQNSDGSHVTPAYGQVYHIYAPFFSTNSVSPTYDPTAPVVTETSANGPVGLNYFSVTSTTFSELNLGMLVAGTGISMNSIVTGLDSTTHTVTINSNTSQAINGSVSFYTATVAAPPALAPVSVTATGTKGDNTLTLSSTSGIDPAAGLVIVNGPGIGINNVATTINATTKVVTLASPNVNDVNGAVVFATQSLLANALTLLPSNMVVAGNGVFADNAYQFPTDTNRSVLLGAIENIIVASFNRGVATNDVSDWSYSFADQQAGVPNPFYDRANANNSSLIWNYYGQFFHQFAVSAYGRAYAISFDDQGGFSTTLSESVNSSVATVTASLLPLQEVLSFDDSTELPSTGASAVSGFTVRSGDIVNAIQTTNGTLAMPQHGDSAGILSSEVLQVNDTITKVSGYTGEWFGRTCVVQLQFETQNGITYGPYGTMDNVGSKTAFSHVAPTGQCLIAFIGTLVNVPLDNGTTANVIQSLSPVFQ